MRYQELVGKRVMTADGENLGRVADLLAEERGGVLRVTALLLGPAALVRRITVKSLPLPEIEPPLKLPWSLVADIEEVVSLRVRRDEIRLDEQASEAGEVRAPRASGQDPDR